MPLAKRSRSCRLSDSDHDLLRLSPCCRLRFLGLFVVAASVAATGCGELVDPNRTGAERPDAWRFDPDGGSLAPPDSGWLDDSGPGFDADLSDGALGRDAYDPDDGGDASDEILDAEGSIDLGSISDVGVEENGADAGAASDSGPSSAALAIAPGRFTWAYDSKDLCRTGAEGDWPPASGGIALLHAASSTVSPPACGASTDELVLDSIHANAGLDLRGGGCWRSNLGEMPDVPLETKAVLRILARFPAGDGVNRYLGGLWGHRSYFRWFQRTHTFFAQLRSEADDGTLPRVGSQSDIDVPSWQLIDLLIDASSGVQPRLVLFANGLQLQGDRVPGVGELVETTLSLGTNAQCAGVVGPSAGNQTILFVGMSIGSDADWFDPNGETHREDCRSLGLCR